MQRDIQREALHHKFTLSAGMRQDQRQEVSNVRQRPKELTITCCFLWKEAETGSRAVTQDAGIQRGDLTASPNTQSCDILYHTYV